MKSKVTLNKIDKEVEKHLKEIAGMLPQIQPAARKRVKGEEIIREATEEQLKTIYKDVEMEQMYIVKTAGAPQAVNHLKRLRSAYMHGHWQGVSDYCEPYRRTEIVAAEETTEAMETLATTTEEAANQTQALGEAMEEALPPKKPRGRPKKVKEGEQSS